MSINNTITLIKANDIATKFNSLASVKTDLAVSMAFYTMVQGNAAPLKELPKSFSNMLPPEYRQFICVKWDKEAGHWKYNKSKAAKLLMELQLVFKKSTFEEFVDAIMAKLAADADAENKVELTEAEKIDKVAASVGNQIKKWLELGLSEATIEIKVKDIILAQQKKLAKDKPVTAAK